MRNYMSIDGRGMDMPRGLARPVALIRQAVRPRDFSWMVVGNLSFAVAQAAILSVLAHLGGPAVVGEFTVALAVVTPTMMFAQLRLRDVVATDAGGERPFHDYLTLTATTSVIAVIVAVGIGLMVDGPGPVAWVVFAWAIARGTEALSLIVYGLQQQRGEMSRVGKSNIARGLLSVVFVGTTYAVTEHLAWSVGSAAVAYLIVFVAYDTRGAYQYLDRTGYRPNWRRLGSLALRSIPLGAFALLTSLNDNIPRLILNETHGKAILGIFGAFGFVVLGGSSITRALGQAAAPRLGASFAAGDSEGFRRQLVGLAGIAGGIGAFALLAAVTIGEPMLRIAFGTEFAAYSNDFVLVVVYASLLFLASPLTVALIAARRYRAQLLIQIASVVAIAIVGLTAIPQYGIRGAALALIASGLVRVIASSTILARSIHSLEPAGSGS